MGAAAATRPDVLIVGAGPSGLTLALSLRAMGVSVRIVDHLTAPRKHSPALAIQPRTLEVLEPLGVVDRLVAAGTRRVDLRVHFPSRSVVGRLDEMPIAGTRYPFVLFVPQPRVEGVLRRRLLELGTEVEWGTELLSWRDDAATAVCRLAIRGGRPTDVRSRFLAGCDGADSTVRRCAGIPFRGRRHRTRLLIADVSRPDLAVDAFVDGRGIVFLFPLATGMHRLIASIPGRPRDEPVAALYRRIGLDPADIRWSDVRDVETRLASHHRRGPAFLVGDAAHVHSPAGAQGMNTGIQDAVNLAWKLATVLRGGRPDLLDSYQRERRRVACRAVVLTEAAFAIEASTSLPVRLGRPRLGPPIARVLLASPRAVARILRMVGGLDLAYGPGVAVDGGRAPEGLPRPGSRFAGELVDEGPPAHRLLVRGADPARTAELAGRYGDALRIEEWTGDVEGVHGAIGVLVRPDGYVAASDAGPRLEVVAAHLAALLPGRDANGGRPGRSALAGGTQGPEGGRRR